MGSDETAITIPGALEKLTFFTGTGRHRARIAHFFPGQIGSWRSLEVGLVVGSRLCRMRRFLGAPRALEAMAKLFMVLWAALMRELAEICWKRQRMRCRRLTMYSCDPKRPQGDLRATDCQDSTGAAAIDRRAPSAAN